MQTTDKTHSKHDGIVKTQKGYYFRHMLTKVNS